MTTSTSMYEPNNGLQSSLFAPDHLMEMFLIHIFLFCEISKVCLNFTSLLMETQPMSKNSMTCWHIVLWYERVSEVKLCKSFCEWKELVTRAWLRKRKHSVIRHIYLQDLNYIGNLCCFFAVNNSQDTTTFSYRTLLNISIYLYIYVYIPYIFCLFHWGSEYCIASPLPYCSLHVAAEWEHTCFPLRV